MKRGEALKKILWRQAQAVRAEVYRRILSDPYEIIFSLMDVHRNILKKKAMSRMAAVELNSKLRDSGFVWMPGG